MAWVSSLYNKWFLKNQNFYDTSKIFGVKTIKMEWDICSSPPWVQFYPYTMFQNPMPKPSCQKSRKTIITQKVLVTQSYNIVHCNWHTHKTIPTDFEAFSNTFSLYTLTFFSFFVRGVKETAKNFTFVDIDWKNA